MTRKYSKENTWKQRFADDFTFERISVLSRETNVGLSIGIPAKLIKNLKTAYSIGSFIQSNRAVSMALSALDAFDCRGFIDGQDYCHLTFKSAKDLNLSNIGKVIDREVMRFVKPMIIDAIDSEVQGTFGRLDTHVSQLENQLKGAVLTILSDVKKAQQGLSTIVQSSQVNKLFSETLLDN